MTSPATPPQLRVVEDLDGERIVDDWESIYRREVEAIYRFVFIRTGNRADAEDLCAQVFLRALPRLRAAEGTHAIRGYLYATARSLVAEYWRLRYRTGSLDGDVVAPEPVAVMDDPDRYAERIAVLLSTLPDRERSVLEMRFLRGYSIQETAHALGISEGNCRVIQHRALKRAADTEDAS